MWAIRNFATLDEFCATARRLGFARIELNHQVDSAMLAGVDLTRYKVSSVHEPCPADISMNELKNRDWLISAPDEQNRKQGVISVKRSIDLAHALGVRVIVVHAGIASSDDQLEKKLVKLFRAGQAGSPEYTDLKTRVIEARAAHAAPHLEAVQRSLVELLAYAEKVGIRLGLENRYHYIDLPIPDEMDLLLNLAGPEQLGFWYDVGHAQTLDRLGFFPCQEWLQRFGGRMVGIHLHDVVGIDDHDAPGSGEVDFAQISSYLPEDAVRTLELKPQLSAEQVKRSAWVLAQYGLLQRM